MRVQRLFAFAVTFWTLLHPGQALAQTFCRPDITVRNAEFSEMVNLRRFWTAAVDVDASACTTWSGLFALGFIRQSEGALDLQFTEPFLWRPGQATVRVEFWANEAVSRHWVADIAACPCRSR